MSDEFPFLKPPPNPTHPPADMMELFGVMRTLGPKAASGPLTPEALAEIAEADGKRLAVVYAAAGMNPAVEFTRQDEVAFVVCTGRCQMWGAYDLIELLLERREARKAAGKKAFDVVPRGCLDQCDKPAALFVSSPIGTAAIHFATAEQIDEAITSLCDD